MGCRDYQPRCMAADPEARETVSGCVGVFWVGLCSLMTPALLRLPGIGWGVWGVGLLLFLLSVCETSYEGHMVDALASRADEGRRSLR
jgi:hypothetical protein